jgi:hypothetical protein
MTLDDFLRTLETLIDDRESTDDDPGQGNFGCEDCRKCNHCRFCVGCDSCEDCTYCDESIDCMSCTQSKRCVSCEKVSYCEDCRDCKSSRYLTLCVNCTDCVHCLGCVGLEGAEFYVLNEKRTRKEYFALLRQVQELMRDRMEAGWRPPAIGLASEIDDPIIAGRNVELTAAPWLEPSAPEPAALPQRSTRDVRRDDYRDDYDDRRERAGVDPRRREPAREPVREPERVRRDVHADDYADEAPRRARETRRPDRDEYEDRRPPAREPERVRYREREPIPERRPPEPARRPAADRYLSSRPADRADFDRGEDWDDRPITRELEWEDSRERTVARPKREQAPREQAPIDDEPEEEDDDYDDEPPHERDHEPSSPWLDDDAQSQARRRAKRGSLRRAGRPKRKADGETPAESTGSSSYRTGSAPARTTSDGTHTGTGLRLGRKPKR